MRRSIALVLLLVVSTLAAAAGSPAGAEDQPNRDLPTTPAPTSALSGTELTDALTNDPTFRDLSDRQASVLRLYLATLGRLPDPAGFDYWSTNGMDLTAMADFFITSDEFTTSYGQLDDTAFVDLLYRNVLGRPGDADGLDYWTGLTPSRGRAAVVLGFSESTEYRATVDAITTTDPAIARQALLDALDADRTLSRLDDREASVLRLYLATLARIPDPAGFDYWSTNGMDLATIAGHFITSPEFDTTYGDLDDAAFVELLYRNVLGRSADAGGSTYWTGQLATRSRAEVVLGFSESAEYAATIDAVTTYDPPNILLLIADDMGVESSPCYALDAVSAPHLEQACTDGIVFDAAWAAPICSPTRAGILTGRHSFRTGIGTAIETGQQIGVDEVTLPRALDLAGTGYAHANFGKWHLGGGVDNPNDMGWSHYEGLISGGVGDYEDWSKVTNGDRADTDVYATTATVDDAAAWIGQRDPDTPWLAWLGFNAPHTPFHVPPSELHTFTLVDDQATIDANPEPYYRAAIQALDTEIGELLTHVDLTETVVIFIGDNGNPGSVSGYPTGDAKGSLGQGGVHVPMIIWGAGIDGGRRTDTLTSTVDLFATILDLAGVSTDDPALGLPVIDSMSLLPVLDGGDDHGRDYVLSEHFGTNLAANSSGKTIRDDRYKLTVLDNGRVQLHDLVDDPTGVSPIRENQRNADEVDAVTRLTQVLDDWTASPTAPAPG